MSLPQKKRGFRKIVVDGTEFNWRFNTQIDVFPATYKDNKIVVDFGWFDAWLYLNDKAATPPDYDPKVITPQFVRNVIEFAIVNNWSITHNTGVTKIKYAANKFTIV